MIFLLNNLFFRGLSSFRDLVVNTHYLVIFRSSRDQGQIEVLGRQLLGKDSYKLLTEAFRHAVVEQPRGYLLIDSRADADSRTALRTAIFPGDQTIVYRKPDGKATR